MTEFVKHPRIAGGVPLPDASADTQIVLRPLGLLYGASARAGCDAAISYPLAGDALAFTGAEMFVELSGQVHHAIGSMAQIIRWAEASAYAREVLAGALRRIARPRSPFAGLEVRRPLVMGIVNVTPDSFSDGGAYADADAAVAQALALVAAGADMIDIGGESTRPGADPVDSRAEIDRVLPVLRRLADAGTVLSIDTRHAPVMEAAIAAGATIVNDISALEDDPGSLGVIASGAVSVILMHKSGDPRTMQDDPTYRHAPFEIFRYLQGRVATCRQAGIPAERISVDPGIGFGKNSEHNEQIVASLAMLHGLGCAVTLGASRKMSGGDARGDRLPGSLAAMLAAADQGVQIHRVHDVAAARQALRTHTRILREY